jgi:hypothetical protein
MTLSRASWTALVISFKTNASISALFGGGRSDNGACRRLEETFSYAMSVGIVIYPGRACALFNVSHAKQHQATHIHDGRGDNAIDLATGSSLVHEPCISVTVLLSNLSVSVEATVTQSVVQKRLILELIGIWNADNVQQRYILGKCTSMSICCREFSDAESMVI